MALDKKFDFHPIYGEDAVKLNVKTLTIHMLRCSENIDRNNNIVCVVKL